MNAAAEVIYDLVDPSANLIFGAVIDPSLSGQVVCIRVLFSTEKEIICHGGMDAYIDFMKAQFTLMAVLGLLHEFTYLLPLC